MLGDAIHTMTPARGAAANTAFRDAALLCNTLTEVQNDDKPLGLATHEKRWTKIGAAFPHKEGWEPLILQFAKRVAQPECVPQGAARSPIVHTMGKGSNAAARIPGRNPLGTGRLSPMTLSLLAYVL